MINEKSLEKFSSFAMEQYKTETKVWVYFFFVISAIVGISYLWVGSCTMTPNGIFSNSWLLYAVALSVGLFLFLYVLRLVSLFLWYVIFFWALRWSPEIRRENFMSPRD